MTEWCNRDVTTKIKSVKKKYWSKRGTISQTAREKEGQRVSLETADHILTIRMCSASGLRLTFIVCCSICLCSPSERSLQVVVLLGQLL